VKVTKKRKTTENGGAVGTATTKSKARPEPQIESAGKAAGGNKKPDRKPVVPFKRVDPDKVAIHVVQDNRYEAKVRLQCYFAQSERTH
jgi:hypothetical protein